MEYYELTGKPLGITGEIGEYTAAKCLELELAEAREAGYDAIDGHRRRLQIKTRALPPSARRRSQRVGAIKLDQPWDAVLLDERFEPMEIWEAGRRAITTAITAPGSKARNERGALAVSRFKSIGRRVRPTTFPCLPARPCYLRRRGTSRQSRRLRTWPRSGSTGRSSSWTATR